MGRCLDDRPILLNRDAVAYGNDKETGVWLRNVGKKYIKLNMIVMFDIKNFFD